jgi:hypothetical protein
MERFIICKNPLCCLVVDLRTQDNRILKISELIVDQCPECAGEWLSHCPFCSKDLDITLARGFPSVLALPRRIASLPSRRRTSIVSKHAGGNGLRYKSSIPRPGSRMLEALRHEPLANARWFAKALGPTGISLSVFGKMAITAYSNRMHSTSRLTSFALHRFPVRAGVRPHGRFRGGAL